MVKRNYIHAKTMRCIANQCLYFSGGLIKLMLRASVSKYNLNENFDVITYPCHNLSKMYHRGNKRTQVPVGVPLFFHYQFLYNLVKWDTNTDGCFKTHFLNENLHKFSGNSFTIFSMETSLSWFEVKLHLFWHELWFGVYDIHWFALVYFWHGQTWQNDSLDALVWKKRFLFYSNSRLSCHKQKGLAMNSLQFG